MFDKMYVGRSKISHREEVRNAYADWIGQYDWTYWATFTTRYKLTMPSARKAVEGMYKQLSKAGNVRIFFVCEPFDLREGYHIHALMQVQGNLKYQHILQTWQHVSGNKRKPKDNEEPSTWNRVELERYDKRKGARHYVGKYMTKNACDYDLLTNCK